MPRTALSSCRKTVAAEAPLGGGMDSRVSRLESDMEHVKKGMEKLDSGVSDIKKTLADFRVDAAKGIGEINTALGTLKERSQHLPTRWEVFLTVSAIVAVIGTVIAAVTRVVS